MSDIEKKSILYSLGLVHGNRNVLRRILKTINEMNPAAGGQRIVDFAKLLGSINDTQLISENGKFVIDANGEIQFEWIQEKRDLIVNEITGEL